MIAWIASLQPVLIAGLLVWTGLPKAKGVDPAVAKAAAVSKLVGERRAVLALRLVGAAELAVAAALLLPVGRSAAAAGSLLLALGFLGYLGYAKIAAPESSCGCSAAAQERIATRHFARAGLLGLVSALALAGSVGLFGAPTGWWVAGWLAAPVAATALLLAEAAGFAMLSPEQDRYWLVPLRALKVRLTHPLGDTATDEVPLLATLQRLQVSEAYRQVGTMIISDVLDSWDSGEWRILEYAARRDGKRTTAVFAVPLHRDDPDAIRVVFVDETREEAVTAPA